MAASTSDKFLDTFNSANPNVASVTATRTAAATTLQCDDLSGWPTATAVSFSTYQISTTNEVVAGTQIDWIGIVSGNNIGSLTRVAGASDSGNTIGDVVEMNPTATWASRLVNGLLVEHGQDGTHNMTSPQITTGINDANDNEAIKLTATSSAVNEVTVANAATGNAPTISATGDDTNIDLQLSGKGTGNVVVDMGASTASETTSGTTTSTSYTATLTGGGTNPAVTVTVPSSGKVIVLLDADLSNSTAGSRTYMSFALTGANTASASDTDAIYWRPATNGLSNKCGTCFIKTGLTPGSTTFTLQYKVSANTGTITSRQISVIPIGD